MSLESRLRSLHSLVYSHQYAKAFKPASNLLDEYPDHPEVLFLAGSVLRGLDCVGMALPIFTKALSMKQDQPNLWMQYAAVLHDLNRWDEARDAFSIVRKMLPNDPMPPANISAGMTQQGRWREAIAQADIALGLDDKNYVAHVSKGFGCLALGRWKEAWKHAEYLYGEHLVVRVYRDKDNEEPAWDGTKNQTVVVTCDQGVGDIIMLSQCLNQMIDDCKLVIIECAERMMTMFQRNFPRATVYGTLKQVTIDWPKNYDIDAHIHLSYLGRFYRNSNDDFPRKPYIKPYESMVQKWRDWLSQFTYPHIGIAWQGGIQKTQKHLRSLELADYEQILNLEGTFIDLSYHDSNHEVALWNLHNKAQIIRPPINVANYDDTIALIAALTEVVTVTTTVAHVCGAIGHSACVIVPEVPTWRYAYHCSDGMIWYPEGSVRLFRRKHGEQDWSHVINRVAKHIEGSSLKLCA